MLSEVEKTWYHTRLYPRTLHIIINMNTKQRRGYIDILMIIKKLKACDRAKIVKYLKSDVIEFLCECTHNVLYTDLGLKNKSQLKKKLKSQCSIHRLKKISSKNTPIEKKVKALKQEGKGIGLILSAAIPFLLSLFKR